MGPRIILCGPDPFISPSMEAGLPKRFKGTCMKNHIICNAGHQANKEEGKKKREQFMGVK